LLQERRVGVDIDRLALVGAVPGVDLFLQRVAEFQQVGILRRQLLDDRSQPRPERVRRNPGFGGRLLLDEIEQDRGDLQPVGVDTFHGGLSRQKWRFAAAFGEKTAKNAPKGGGQGALLATSREDEKAPK